MPITAAPTQTINLGTGVAQATYTDGENVVVTCESVTLNGVAYRFRIYFDRVGTGWSLNRRHLTFGRADMFNRAATPQGAINKFHNIVVPAIVAALVAPDTETAAEAAIAATERELEAADREVAELVAQLAAAQTRKVAAERKLVSLRAAEVRRQRRGA